jgi:two-component system response regulator AtoC
MAGNSVLIVEDEAIQKKVLEEHLSVEGYEVFSVETVEQALHQVEFKTIDAVITDYNLPDQNGIYLIEQIKAINPEIPSIMITAYGTIDSAVNAMKSGAYDYLTKPININELLVVLKRALEHKTLVSENRRLRAELKERFSPKGIVAKSPKMQHVLHMVSRVASSKASVLLRGESGTGKEVIAKTLHFASPRKEGPFVAFNAAALSPTLIESELFGHEKGAFTGAYQTRDGRFVQAHRGTLFIDEIGDIPLELQSKFLRVLQENYVERLGGHKQIEVDIRVVAATNKDLETMMRKGFFREDLFYRLNVISLELPALRDRKEDILPLCDLFIQKYSLENDKTISGFSRNAFDAIIKYDFPGNVRELENIIERAVILAQGKQITVEDLPPNIFTPILESKPISGAGLDKQVEILEKQLIQSELRKAGGNQSKAARALEISERKLRYKLKKYHIT